MTVLTFAAADLFVFRVVKYLSTNPDNKWANSYEFRANATGTESDLLTAGEKLVDFEVAFHRTNVIFDRILISTWEADSVPYDPSTFISSTLTAIGTAAISGDMMALNTCMSVARIAASGRFGHLFYRGVLLEEDVEAPAGRSVLVDRAAQQANIDAALSSSGLGDYIDPFGDTAVQMAMINKDGTQVRKITQLRVQGVSSVPLDHAWFNRTPAP